MGVLAILDSGLSVLVLASGCFLGAFNLCSGSIENLKDLQYNKSITIMH